LDGFYATWSNARATFGQGTPQTGEPFDQSGALDQLRARLDATAPGSRWSGDASVAYAAANAQHQQVIGEIADLDRRLAAQINDAARIVTTGRQNLDAVHKWVTDAAASVPQNQAGQYMLLSIASSGISKVADVVESTNAQLNTVADGIQAVRSQYSALANQRFASGEGTAGQNA